MPQFPNDPIGMPQSTNHQSPDESPDRQTAPPASVTDLPKPAVAPTRGSVTDEKAREKTGHGLDHWFAVLDRFGGVEKGHSASARHLYDDHGVPGWYAQGITVAYERARGAPHGRAGSLH